MKEIEIIINGKSISVTEPISLQQLIKQLEINKGKFAVDINGQIIPKSEYQNCDIREHDNIEIVVAVGGG